MPHPDYMRAVRGVFNNLLTAAGFTAPSVCILPLQWRTKNTQDILDLIYKSIVRTPMILQAQAAGARERISPSYRGRSRKLPKGRRHRAAIPRGLSNGDFWVSTCTSNQRPTMRASGAPVSVRCRVPSSLHFSVPAQHDRLGSASGLPWEDLDLIAIVH
jgi:hypothetical protein